MPNVIHWIGAFFLLAATALLVVVSVTAPIWDTVGFLKGDIQGLSFTFGNWGYCTANGCSSARLGYDRNFIEQVTDYDGAGRSILHGLSYALILNPICAGLSLLALLFALGTNTALGVIASLLSLLAFIATVVALGLDLGLFITARHRIRNDIPNSNAHLSTAIWLVLAACVCQLIAGFTVCFTRSRRRAAARDREFAAVPAMQTHPVRQSTSTDAAPSVVGSTGPLMHETGPGFGSTAGQPVGPTTTSATRGHWWQRKKATAAY
ncbi:hypothetical protein JCM6882_002184 [Rhodosporidiobolus microsporus]